MGELAARMTAMQAASDNAKELKGKLEQEMTARARPRSPRSSWRSLPAPTPSTRRKRTRHITGLWERNGRTEDRAGNSSGMCWSVRHHGWADLATIYVCVNRPHRHPPPSHRILSIIFEITNRSRGSDLSIFYPTCPPLGTSLVCVMHIDISISICLHAAACCSSIYRVHEFSMNYYILLILLLML